MIHLAGHHYHHCHDSSGTGYAPVPTGYGPAQQGYGQQPVYPQIGKPGLYFTIIIIPIIPIIIPIIPIIIIFNNISGYVAPEDKGMLGELGSGALNMVKTLQLPSSSVSFPNLLIIGQLEVLIISSGS